MTPPHAPRRLVIATRESALAMWQAHHIQVRLQQLYPRASIDLFTVGTPGDVNDDAALGGRDSSDRAIDVAIADGRADIAVRSLKDLPADLSEGFVIAAIEPRDDPRDALVSNRYASLDAMPSHARVGTPTLACEAQLRERYSNLDYIALHGSVRTCIGQLDNGDLDGAIVPASVARWLGLADRIVDVLDPSVLLPPPGQGALALVCRAGRHELIGWLAQLADRATLLAVTAERAFARPLAGNRHTPLAAHATWQEGTLWLRGLIASRDGHKVLHGEREASVQDVDEAAALGSALADDLLAHGAGRFIQND